ncbi:MAG: ligase-associated DNA damage response endonuclease PdeM [Rhodospirillales bacterium]|nr:MAG: ligase-associated DNA damage response endonuclease PdeM [Rhodospirillales bacterium]
MTGTPLTFGGVAAIALPEGALLLPDHAALVVADLHLEKGSGLARQRCLLPPYDTRATLDRLEVLIRRWQPRLVICLGDSFHDGGGTNRMAPADRDGLGGLMAGRTWIWIAGNHDGVHAGAIGGQVVASFRLGPLTLRHQADGSDDHAAEVSGHFHPKAAVAAYRRRITLPCFVDDNRRLILPAFGAYTGGLDVFDPALTALLAPRFRVHVLGRDRVHTLPAAALLRPR